MAQQTLEIQQLAGQARNPVYGQTGQGQMVPYRVFNLVPDRMGGYTPFGRRMRLLDSLSAPITLDHIDRLIGFDETGISSFYTNDAAPKLRLFHGTTTHQQLNGVDYDAADMVTGDASPLTHLDGAGAYLDRNRYLVLDRDDRRMEPIAIAVGASANVGASITAVAMNGLTESLGVGGLAIFAMDVAHADGTFIAVGEGYIERNVDDGTGWNIVHTDASANFTSVEYGNGRFMALDCTQGEVVYSTDDGLTWSGPVDFRSGYPSKEGYRLAWVSGDIWVAVGEYIWRTTDGGATWALVDDLAETNSWRIATVGRDADGRLFAPSYHRYASPERPTHIFFSDDDGATWARNTNVAQDVLMIAEGAVASVPLGSGFLAGGVDGRVSRFETKPVGSGFAVDRYQRVGSVLLDDTIIIDVAYCEAADFYAVVGSDTTGTEPRVWHSNDAGVSWTRVTAVEESFTAAGANQVSTVVFDANGDGMYIGSGISIFTGLSIGLSQGNYDVYVVSYFNTKAGKFAFNFTRTRVNINAAAGGSISVEVPSKTEISDGNLWIAGSDPAIVDDLRYDVYIQKVAEAEAGDITPLYTIRYAYTEPFPASPGSSRRRNLDSLPLGRQLLTEGVPTTVVFEKTRTALHNGRVWGMANQDEDLWEVNADSMNPGIANQFNRFVLCYTEIGWANLVGDQSFIPIQPTQSTRFTGLLSTPSGLMVMFDNEIFLVTGDPAFGNVAVELYLDMAGCDYGTYPCKVGGIPFVIWNGKVWALQAGQAAQVGAEQWRKDDPFVRVTPEPQTRSLLALTEAGLVFRYVLDDQFWLTDPVTRDGSTVVEMLPNYVDANDPDDHTRFVLSAGEVYTSRKDGTPDTPHIVWRDVDFGFPERRTPLYLVKATFEGDVLGQVYDRDDVSYDADAIPALFYSAASQSNGDTWETVDPQASGGIAPYAPDLGGRSVGTLSWRPPLGATKSYTVDLRLELRGMGLNDVLRLPMRFFHSAGGETR